MREMKRFTAWILLILCLISAGTSPAEETSVSLFAATDRHSAYLTQTAETGSSGKRTKAGKKKSGSRSGSSRVTTPVLDENGDRIWQNNLTAVLKLVAEDENAVQPDTVLLGGDMVGQSGTDAENYPMKTPWFSVSEIDEEIASVLGENIRSLYTYGSHDLNETGAYKESFLSGPAEGEGYWVYGISYGQMIYATDEQAASYAGKDAEDTLGASAESAAQSFLSWAEGLEDHWPIIVMTHVPLHAHRQDNLGAEIWASALNQAAEDHDILVLWGHNHTIETGKNGNASERAVYLLPPGSMMSVQGVEKSRQEDMEIRFAYMNAGYLINGTGSLLTFRNTDEDDEWDEMTVRRYSLKEEENGFTWTWILRSWEIIM